MRTSKYAPGQRVMFAPSYEDHVHYEAVVTECLEGIRVMDYDYRIKITKRVTWTDPQRRYTSQPRHLLREVVPALEAELHPILRTPADIEEYLAT